MLYTKSWIPNASINSQQLEHGWMFDLQKLVWYGRRRVHNLGPTKRIVSIMIVLNSKQTLGVERIRLLCQNPGRRAEVTRVRREFSKGNLNMFDLRQLYRRDRMIRLALILKTNNHSKQPQ